jgi:transcriptional regulator with XRE-family HTH domain
MVIKLKNKSEFANRLMQRRKEIGLSRTELGENIGFSGQQANKNIYNYENSIREPEYATLVKIAEVLQCSTDYLLGATDNPNKFLGTINGSKYEIEMKDDAKNKPYDKEQFEDLIRQIEQMRSKIDRLMEEK